MLNNKIIKFFLGSIILSTIYTLPAISQIEKHHDQQLTFVNKSDKSALWLQGNVIGGFLHKFPPQGSHSTKTYSYRGYYFNQFVVWQNIGTNTIQICSTEKRGMMPVTGAVITYDPNASPVCTVNP